MVTKVFGENYTKYYDLFNDKKNYDIESDFLDKIFNKYAPNKVKNILDLGCGTGLHAKKLTSKGYSIFGLDLSNEMIKIAKTRNIQNAEFAVGNMSNFKIDKNFDACICMFAAFGYLTKNNQIKSFFESVKKHLNSRGILVLDCWNGLGVMHKLPIKRSKKVELKGMRIVRTSFPEMHSYDHICKVRFKVEFFGKDASLLKKYEENHEMRFFFPQEIIKYAEDTGFEILEICVPFELGIKIDETSWNMVIIARLKQGEISKK